MAGDGIVSRYLNRPLGRPAARAVAKTPVAPVAASGFTLLLAIAAGGMLAFGWNIAGGIAIAAVGVFDAVPGELARIRHLATRFAEVFDAVAARYADAAILGGMTVYAARFEDLPHAETIGMLALAGALIVSYSRARIEADLGAAVTLRSLDSVFGFASRDVRLLAAAVGAVAGQCYWTLVLLATVSALTITWRLASLRVHRIGMGAPPR